jgi:hypothetical protein
MNEKDMAAMFLDQRELVNLIGEYNGVTRSAEQFHAIKFDIPRGCCATYFPETNCLVPIDSFADRSKTPVSKFIEIRIEKRTNAG